MNSKTNMLKRIAKKKEHEQNEQQQTMTRKYCSQVKSDRMNNYIELSACVTRRMR
jgi:hypothetical protein